VSRASLIAIVGPTAAGKSALAMALAIELGAEIVNADAFCLYRGMDIGTAKPSRADQAAIAHHVLDTHEVSDDVDVATYQRMARVAIEEITGRGVPAILVGGSGLYVQAVLDDLRFPGTDPRIRQRLEAELDALGPAVLHARLAEIDPAAAAQILPSNGRRIVRAIEVNELTGASFTATLNPNAAWRPSIRIGWDPGLETVDARIEARVRQMWADGFPQEVASLAPRMGRTASRAVGYRQLLDDPGTALEATIRATRQLARRQRRWFRRDRAIQPVETIAQARAILGRLEA
jgi:tRNA dimethylallyltransferase